MKEFLMNIGSDQAIKNSVNNRANSLSSLSYISNSKFHFQNNCLFNPNISKSISNSQKYRKELSKNIFKRVKSNKDIEQNPINHAFDPINRILNKDFQISDVSTFHIKSSPKDTTLFNKKKFKKVKNDNVKFRSNSRINS
jgi:hypothetical protein